MYVATPLAKMVATNDPTSFSNSTLFTSVIHSVFVFVECSGITILATYICSVSALSTSTGGLMFDISDLSSLERISILFEVDADCEFLSVTFQVMSFRCNTLLLILECCKLIIILGTSIVMDIIISFISQRH